ncbi:hypothetical protein GSI_06814 [Ganoderma sinense ZZ0214-1]|uniref:DNA-directed RNA polymerase III subunit RPC6 n=1 Tax=Ganoderma sinense ZZ0214-1 TaxID=1077348 RepID=A0A2G8SEU8_9APHY|nr:hypothetical protein GSI_06814 [Ganoderma sinense ZZ0214-1]
MSGSRRKLNPLEQKLHQAALADPKKTVTQKECDALIPNPSARLQAINFLLGTGLWKALKDTSGNLSYRVVTKKELEVKKDMSGEEGMILSYIQSAGNEGIWTKHLKAKTELHQTVIDRCIKSLMQKQLIKAVKSVKYPTRKIYMLYHLEPSVEMTGGPWYTDNELDTEFIKLLCSASLRFIRERSTPKQKGGEVSSADRPLYPISAAPAYPTTQQVLTFLSKSRITETQLSAEHVEMLLNVLVLDGEIERVPAFGAAMWDVTQTQEDNASDNEREDGKRAKEKGKGKDRKRKRKEREESDSPQRNRKRNKRNRTSSGSESESQSDNDDTDDERERRRKRDKKRKSRSLAARSEDDDDQEGRKRKKKRWRDHSGDEDGEGDVEVSDADRKSTSKGKKRKKSKHYSSESDSDGNSDDDRRSRSRSKSKSKSVRKRSASPAGEEDVTATLLGQDYGAYVYRAVRQEGVAGGGGGLAQAPCVRCSVFEFCKEGGPVNAGECEYYGSWLVAADVAKG